jgi:hypothetical protein
MDAKYIIYGLLDPRTGQLRYIGKSCSGLKRPKSHGWASSLRVPSHKTNWIKGLLGAGLSYEILVLESYDFPEALNAAEVELIAYYRFIGCDLTNATVGGNGVLGHRFSHESRLRMSEAHKGRPSNRKGVILSEETKRKIAEAHRGKKRSLEFRQKMSEIMTGSVGRNAGKNLARGEDGRFTCQS